LELISYMITSARNLINETKLYGPFRMVDSVSRIIEILTKFGFELPEFKQIGERIEAGKYSVMEGEEKFTLFLEELVLSLIPVLEKYSDLLD